MPGNSSCESTGDNPAQSDNGSSQEKGEENSLDSCLEATIGLEPMIRVLQTRALSNLATSPSVCLL